MKLKYTLILIDLIFANIKKGEFKQAENIIKYLENKEVDNATKALLIKSKASLAVNQNNTEEIEKYKCEFEKISSSIPKKIKNNIEESFKLYSEIIENKTEEIDKRISKIKNKKMLLDMLDMYYFKAVILEKRNDENYKKCYKFVAENGKDLYIAKISRNKLGITQEMDTKEIKNNGIKLWLLIIICIFIVTSECFYEKTKIKWDTGIINLNNYKIKLPITNENISDEIDTTNKNQKEGFYRLPSKKYSINDFVTWYYIDGKYNRSNSKFGRR